MFETGLGAGYSRSLPDGTLSQAKPRTEDEIHTVSLGASNQATTE